jgi:hypothetical protein
MTRDAERGLFKYTKIDRIFNADLVEAYNMLVIPGPTE